MKPTLSVKSFEALGTPASHGCVRLLVSDAKWIYDNCKEGTIITGSTKASMTRNTP